MADLRDTASLPRSELRRIAHTTGDCPICGFGTNEADRLRAEVHRLRKVIEAATNVMGPGDDEDSDSAANMAFAVLMHGLEGGES